MIAGQSRAKVVLAKKFYSRTQELAQSIRSSASSIAGQPREDVPDKFDGPANVMVMSWRRTNNYGQSSIGMGGPTND
jgi:hypothetical protein